MADDNQRRGPVRALATCSDCVKKQVRHGVLDQDDADQGKSAMDCENCRELKFGRYLEKKKLTDG